MKKFTLIELLVVVAIIGILASLLLPVLGKARRQAQTSVSINNMKQIFLVTEMYADDNDGFLMPYQSPDHYTWDDRIFSYLGIELTEDEKIDALPDDRSGFDILRCPLDDVPRLGIRVKRTYITNGMTGNSTIGVFSEASQTSLQDLTAPTETILFAEFSFDSNSIGNGAKATVIGTWNLDRATIINDDRASVNHHQNGSKNPILFADGHTKPTYMPNTRANNYYLWDSKR